LKKPVSQNETGRSRFGEVSQLLSWKCLSFKPLSHAASDGVNQEISTPVGSSYHFLGTLKSATAFMHSTSSEVIII
jgi:hypothetical protein